MLATHKNRRPLSASVAPPPLQEDAENEQKLEQSEVKEKAENGQSLEAELGCSPALMLKLINFLEEDLPHLFDERGITKEQYETQVDFRDPITRYSSVDGYLFNIQMLRYLFSPKFELHSVKQSGPSEITTRWTMMMRFALLPWRPELIFTGTSVMGINPTTGKFLSHVDYWDSIKNNDYFSLEGVTDVLKQLWYYKTPDLETPKYNVLKRANVYEVRKYEPFIVVEAPGDQLTGSKGFKNVTSYIFGNNSTGERIPMTTPVITSTVDYSTPGVSIQVVLPIQSTMSSLPAPLPGTANLREVSGGIIAAIKFTGETTEELVRSKERELRSALNIDGLHPKPGFMLARYNDPGRTWDRIRRNEVFHGSCCCLSSHPSRFCLSRIVLRSVPSVVLIRFHAGKEQKATQFK
ncbi:hypothetical protein GOP47_0010321 [Adiantum capillus-veneris]|uniref:SOUL heme-binding protein n=1 Tax=Adiantum capillus-veneris TaxID=13818 RepID=A0A9D4UV24_ADICA|nr:hypothetical protein GOP47_0010321 [Adiantum capillus-veneris]